VLQYFLLDGSYLAVPGGLVPGPTAGASRAQGGPVIVNP
jgi:hypothetical protein